MLAVRYSYITAPQQENGQIQEDKLWPSNSIATFKARRLHCMEEYYTKRCIKCIADLQDLKQREKVEGKT